MTPDTQHGALLYVAGVNIIIWAGIFVYLVYLDRKVKAALKSSGETK